MSSSESESGAPVVTAQTHEGDIYRIAVRGQIDLSTVPTLRKALTTALDCGCHHVIVDMAEVRYIDSSGFGAFLGATKRLRPIGGTLYLVGCTAPIERLLTITRLDTIFEMFASEQGARQAIRAAQMLERAFPSEDGMAAAD